MQIFKKNMINKKNAAQVAAYNKVQELCTKGPDNYLEAIGLEEAVEELLELLPRVDFIGFISSSYYDEEKECRVYTLKIEQRIEKIDRAICFDKSNNHKIAEAICKSQNIDPDFIGGQENGYIHISEGSRHCPEGYTLGYRI